MFPPPSRFRVFAFPPPSAAACAFAPRIRCRVPPEIVGGARHDRGVLTPTRLFDSGTGRWRVVTQTSAHRIDLDGRAVTRIDGGGTPMNDAGFRVSALRRDCESVPLIELVRCEIGCPMTLLIRVREDCVTVRRTTPVIAITPGDERSPHA